MRIDRRNLLSLLGGAGAVCLSGHHAQAGDALSGELLFADVVAYSELGEHRTGSQGDNGTTVWLADRLERLGFRVDAPTFPFPLFVPELCEMSAPSGSPVALFPTWPVVSTSSAGLTAPLALADSGSTTNAIAIVPLSNAAVGGLAAAGVGSALLAAEDAGARAVVGITEGPSDEIIAQNADLEKYAWNIPVLLAAGRDEGRLMDAARRGETWRVACSGKSSPDASAANIVAHRPGRGKTIVVSTPKSGWFHCAGERGTGAAIFLALAARLAITDADLLFLSASGHEIDGLGGKIFLKTSAPDPKSVRLWMHLGANVACEQLARVDGTYRKLGRPTDNRRMVASAELATIVAQAFAGQPSYSAPKDVQGPNVGPEIAVYRNAGYSPLVGMLGGSLVHHTQADMPDLVTSPKLLEPVARGLDKVLQAAAAG